MFAKFCLMGNKKAQEFLELSDFNSSLIKTIPFGLDIVDENGNILFLNKAMESIVGRDAIGKKCWELYRDDRKQCKDCPLIKGIKVGETSSINSGGVLGGKTFRISHTGMVYHGKKSVLEIFQDVTEFIAIQKKLKQANEELSAALKVKSEFTSMVSHELRTPLTAIKEGIGIVFDGTAGSLTKEQTEFLSIAKRNVDRLARLINDILDFQKLEAGVIAFNIQENSINETVKEACKMMTGLAGEKGLKLVLNLDEKLPRLKFDKDKITQVLENLVNNAVKFTKNGSITVVTRREDNAVHVSVEDTGLGIKEEDLPRLFQKFSQLESGLERKTGGSGLGLAISKEIIEKHKGKIWAESKEGKGSAFHFLLPIAERKG